MLPRVTLHYLVSSIFLNEDFRWSICGSLAHFKPRTCIPISTYIGERAGRFSSGKGGRSVIRHGSYLPSQTIRKRRLILSAFGNEIFRELFLTPKPAFLKTFHSFRSFIMRYEFLHITSATTVTYFFSI